MSPHKSLFTLTFCAFGALFVSPSMAIIIADRSTYDPNLPTGLTTAPIENVGFNTNQAKATATYIGNGWAIGAAHAFGGVNHIELDGQLYNWSQSTGISHTLTSGSIEMDIRLFKLEGDVHLPDVAVTNSPVTVGEEVTIAGTGSIGSKNDQGTAAAGDDVFDWPGTRTDTAGLAVSAGGIGQTTWGTNIISSVYSSFFGGPRFEITFDDPFSTDATTYEAQGGNGDSGGAAFVFRNGQWELAGMLIDVDGKAENQSVYGQSTTFIDLGEFHDQIQQCIIPEPGSALLALAGVFALGLRRKR